MPHAIIINITTEVLARALNLPPGARITAIEYNGLNQLLAIRIDHPDLPDCPESCQPLVASDITSTDPADQPAHVVATLLERKNE